METESNEWISIGDLMAGVVAVVIIMFLIAALQNSMYFNYQDEISLIKEKLSVLAKELETDENISVDVENMKITMEELSFRSASACLSSEGRTSVETIANSILEIMGELESAYVMMSGHTDSVPVSGATGRRSDLCASSYSDNIELSIERARVVRDRMLTTVPNSNRLAFREKIGILGVGAMKPLRSLEENALLSNEEQRRVEIVFDFIR